MTDTPTADGVVATFRACLAEVEGAIARYEAERDALVAGLRQLLAEVDGPARSRRGQLGTFGRPIAPGDARCSSVHNGYARCVERNGHAGDHRGAAGATWEPWEPAGLRAPRGRAEAEQIANTHPTPCPTRYATTDRGVLRCRRKADHDGGCRELNPPTGQKARTW